MMRKSKEDAMQPGNKIQHRKSQRTTWIVCAVNYDGTLEVRRWLTGRQRWTFKHLSRPEEYKLAAPKNSLLTTRAKSGMMEVHQK